MTDKYLISMNRTTQIKKEKEIKDMLVFLEDAYQHELSEGHGINSETMKEYGLIRKSSMKYVQTMNEVGI